MAIRIDGEALGGLMNLEDSRHCLDLQTGDLVPREQCAPNQTGWGPSAVASGKRYIQIPNHDELVVEHQRGLEQAWCDHPDSDLCRREDMSDNLRTLLELDDVDAAQARVALDWLRSLKIPETIHWIEDHLELQGIGDGVRLVLPPGSDWIKLPY